MKALRIFIAVLIVLFWGLPLTPIFYILNYPPPLWMNIAFIVVGIYLAKLFYESNLLRKK